MWKEFSNWTADSSGDVGQLSNGKRMPSAITVGVLCLAQALKGVMDWAGTPEKHLAEVFAETKGDGQAPLGLAEEISLQ